VASDCDSFAPIYDEWAATMTEDVPFYVELAREADGPIVELAVGTGRVVIPVARETGSACLASTPREAMLAFAQEL
jgi:ubiquinone/menaquinone biosynthesis C-methylase UbiE